MQSAHYLTGESTATRSFWGETFSLSTFFPCEFVLYTSTYVSPEKAKRVQPLTSPIIRTFVF